MSHENGTTAGLNYKSVSYWLIGALVGLVGYIFLNTVAAQQITDARQDSEINDLRATSQRLLDVSIRLSQIVEQHDRIVNPGKTQSLP
jgi:hypothetical protein